MPDRQRLEQTNLPLHLTRFIGRTSELEALSAALDECRLVTLTGAAGCGKTRLAVEVAGRRLDRYRDGVWFVDLAAVASAELVPHQVMAALGLREAAAGDVGLSELVVRALARKQALLILDNCEHVVGACAVFIDTLPRRCAEVIVVATSREPLRIAGETTWRIPSLDAANAVDLFVDRASAAHPGVKLTGPSAEVVTEICRQLDGIPLALELAAARLRALTPQQVLDGLQDRLSFLAGGSRAAVPRQQTLRSSIEWSFDLLSASERVLLRRVSVFAGSADLNSLLAVAAFGEIEPQQVLELVAGLVDKSLVQMEEPRSGAARYRLLDSIRGFGQEQLVAAGEDYIATSRHLAECARLASIAEPYLIGGEQDAWLKRLDAELPNLRAAMHAARERRQTTEMLLLAGKLAFYWTHTGKLTEGCSWLSSALDLADDATEAAHRQARAGALWALTEVAFSRGDVLTTSRLATDGLALAEEMGDRVWEARARTHLGWTTATMLDPAAEGHWKTAAAVAHETGDRWSIQEVLGGQAVGEMWRGRAAPARALARELAAVAGDGGGRYHVTMALLVEGWSSLYLGQLGAARAANEEVVQRSRSFGDGLWLALGLWQLAWVLRHQGDLGRARALATECRDLCREQGVRLFGESPALSVLSEVERAEGNASAAVAAAEAALEIQRSDGPIPGTLPWQIACSALAAAAAGDRSSARDASRAAIDAASAGGDEPSWQAAHVRTAASAVALAGDDDSEAEALALDALAIQREIGDVVGRADALDVVACVLAGRGAHAEAVRLLGACDQSRQELGYPRGRADASRAEQLVAQLRADLGDAPFAAAHEEGAAAGAEAVAEWVTRGRGQRRRPSAGWASLTPTELEVAGHVAAASRIPRSPRRCSYRGTPWRAT